MKSYESLAEALDDLRERGYEADFEPQLNSLYCSEMDLRLEEEEFHIDEVYCFDGNSNPAENSVVYAFTSPTGIKGTIVDRLGASANDMRLEVAQEAANQSTPAAGQLVTAKHFKNRF